MPSARSIRIFRVSNPCTVLAVAQRARPSGLWGPEEAAP